MWQTAGLIALVGFVVFELWRHRQELWDLLSEPEE